MNDVRHLFRLKRALFSKLKEIDLLDAYILRNLMAQNSEIRNYKKDKYKRAKGYNRLNKFQRAAFRDFYMVRDEFAKKLDKPPDYVFNNASLLALCKNQAPGSDAIETGMNRRLSKSTRDDLYNRIDSLLAKHWQRNW